MLIDKIEQLLKEIKEVHASNAEELEALRIKYLSKKGEINALMADFRNVAADQKREVGMRINELKQQVTDIVRDVMSDPTNRRITVMPAEEEKKKKGKKK